MSAMIPESSEWLIVLLGAVLWTCAGAVASLPWFSAHLAFWGWRKDDRGDAEAARRLSRLCLACLPPLFFLCAALLLLASVAHPPAFFTALVRLIGPAAALPASLLVSAALLFAHGERGEFFRARPGLAHLAPMSAGVLMAPCAGLGWAFALANLNPALFGGDAGEVGRLLALPAFWWGMVHFYLSALVVGGLVLMLLGGLAFRWKSRTPASSGARLVRLGAGVSLLFLMVQIGVAGGLFLPRGSDFTREMLATGGRPLLALGAVGVLCVIALFESLLSALRRRGSAPAAGAIALCLFFVLSVCAGSARLALNKEGSSLFGPAASPRRIQGGLR